MVRKYRLKNPYCRNTKLNEHQFKQLMYRLFNLDRYETITEKEGISANTASKLALRLNARIVGDKSFRDGLMARMQRTYPEICGNILDLQNEQVPDITASFWHCMYQCQRSFTADHRTHREIVTKYYPHAARNAQSPAAMDDYDSSRKFVVTILCRDCVWAQRLGVAQEAKDELLYILFQSIEIHRLSTRAAPHHLWRFYLVSCVGYRATRLMFKHHSLEEIESGNIDSTRFLRASHNEFVNNLLNLLIANPL